MPPEGFVACSLAISICREIVEKLPSEEGAQRGFPSLKGRPMKTSCAIKYAISALN